VIPSELKGVQQMPAENSASGPMVSRKDRLVRWRRAAAVLGVSDDSLSAWYEAGHVPAVQTPGLLFTYQSWLDAVLNGARPGKAADIAEIGRQWFEDHVPQALEGVA
jgi:2-keto-3-deoxy-6-phosphogluconate aldolase